jgi:hypothetical protein
MTHAVGSAIIPSTNFIAMHNAITMMWFPNHFVHYSREHSGGVEIQCCQLSP